MYTRRNVLYELSNVAVAANFFHYHLQDCMQIADRVRVNKQFVIDNVRQVYMSMHIFYTICSVTCVQTACSKQLQC